MLSCRFWCDQISICQKHWFCLLCYFSQACKLKFNPILWAVSRYAKSARVLLYCSANPHTLQLKQMGWAVWKVIWSTLKVFCAMFFYFKLGLFVMHGIARHIQARPSLELKTWPRFHPVSFSFSKDGFKVLPLLYLIPKTIIKCFKFQ
jgi:hypothetical protein